jgi:hypothetical protein
VDDGVRLAWKDVHNVVRSTLTAIAAPEARRDAVRAVVRQLIARGMPERALPLTSQVFGPPGAEQVEALGLSGLELFKAGANKEAKKVADQLLGLYAEKEKRPPLTPAVVTLALVLKLPPPKPAAVLEAENNLLGRAEALAREGSWADARKVATSPDISSVEGKLRALIALADVAVEAKTGDTRDVEAAIIFLKNNAKVLKTKLNDRDRPKFAWLMLRLVRLGLAADLPEDRVQEIVRLIPDRGVQAWAQLTVLRAQLAASKQAVDVDAADRVAAKTLAHLIALQEVARHNVRLDGSWVKKVREWEEGPQAFGSLGAALGLREAK